MLVEIFGDPLPVINSTFSNHKKYDDKISLSETLQLFDSISSVVSNKD